jgi:hypothetical protein
MTLDRIMDKLRQWGRPWEGGSEPLEIHRALLEAIEAQVVAVGGGRRIFPFDRVEVRLLAADPGDKERLQAIVHAGWNLEREAAERLQKQGVRVPAGFAVPVEVTAEAGPDFGNRRYALAFRNSTAGRAAEPAPGSGPGSGPASAFRPQVSAPVGMGKEPAEGGQAGETGPVGQAGPTASPAAPAAHPAIAVAVVKGTAVRERYDLRGERIYLGRLEEVLDAAGRVKRRNDVAFLEEGELNQTVSREHARIAWDAESASYWLRDEGSAAGTLIFRAGRSIEVSRHDRRGVRLQDGDEVFLGRAAVKIGIG